MVLTFKLKTLNKYDDSMVKNIINSTVIINGEFADSRMTIA